MADIINISRIYEDKYKVNFPIGEIIEYKYFKRIIINNEIDWFFKYRTGQEWSRKSIKRAMKDGVVQILLTWVSSDDYYDEYLKVISIIMGLEKKIVGFNKRSYKHIFNYTLYYQVTMDSVDDVSPKLKTFDEAFVVFKNTIMEFIGGTQYR